MTGESVRLTPLCSKEVAERALLRARRYDMKENAYTQLNLEREDGRQLVIAFDGYAHQPTMSAPKKARLWSVYQIKNGRWCDIALTGTLGECQHYVRQRRKDEQGFDCIVLEAEENHADRQIEVLRFTRGDEVATIATDGTQHVVEESNGTSGPAIRKYATLKQAIAHLEAQRYCIDTEWHQSL